MLLIKFILIWLIAGFTCTAITVLHDVLIEKIKIRKYEIKGMFAMTMLGFVSVPIIAYFFFDEYKYKFRRG